MEYRIKSEIGRGGFGIVELGRADNGCDYALKKLNIEAFSPSEIPVLTKRFEREVRYQNQINHRDLKPANVLKFKTDEEDITYKVSDFGMTTPGAGQTTTLTGSNMAGGTVMLYCIKLGYFINMGIFS